VPLNRTRTPWPVTFSTPSRFTSGCSLLATQTTVPGVILLYHIPKYLLLELPGLKNPSPKLPSAETTDSPSFMDWPGARVSDMAEIFTSEIKRKVHKTITLNLSIDFPSRFHSVLSLSILHMITTSLDQ